MYFYSSGMPEQYFYMGNIKISRHITHHASWITHSSSVFSSAWFALGLNYILLGYRLDAEFGLIQLLTAEWNGLNKYKAEFHTNEIIFFYLF